jgi:hypothetical protein
MRVSVTYGQLGIIVPILRLLYVYINFEQQGQKDDF